MYTGTKGRLAVKKRYIIEALAVQKNQETSVFNKIHILSFQI